MAIKRECEWLWVCVLALRQIGDLPWVFSRFASGQLGLPPASAFILPCQISVTEKGWADMIKPSQTQEAWYLSG